VAAAVVAEAVAVDVEEVAVAGVAVVAMLTLPVQETMPPTPRMDQRPRKVGVVVVESPVGVVAEAEAVEVANTNHVKKPRTTQLIAAALDADGTIADRRGVEVVDPHNRRTRGAFLIATTMVPS
jgi:hypothetical protein